MIKNIILIEGMHCRSCEILLSEELEKISGVKKVIISYKKGQAELYSEKKLELEKIERAVIKAGYRVRTGDVLKIPWLTRKLQDYKELGFVILLIGILFLLLKQVGLFDLDYSGSGNPSNLLVVLILGLLAGISTCMALVGGLVLGISARYSEKHPGATTLEKFRPHLFFNFGRIITFFILGGVVGLLGRALQFSSFTLALMIIIAGLVMLFLGFQLIEISPRISKISLTLPVGLAKMLGINRSKKEYSHLNSTLIGALTFFLPCGFTQAMQIYAVSTGSFLKGALVMGIFALGTTPGLLGLGGLTSAIKGVFSSLFYKFVGVIVIILAILNLSNGINLTGWKGLFNRSSVNTQSSNAIIKDGVQVIETTYISGQKDIQPSDFVVVVGKPVRLEIKSNMDVSGCMSSVMIPGLVQTPQFLVKDKVINFEFTPEKKGEFLITCAMGTVRGKITVI